MGEMGHTSEGRGKLHPVTERDGRPVLTCCMYVTSMRLCGSSRNTTVAGN